MGERASCVTPLSDVSPFSLVGCARVGAGKVCSQLSDLRRAGDRADLLAGAGLAIPGSQDIFVASDHRGAVGAGAAEFSAGHACAGDGDRSMVGSGRRVRVAFGIS